MVRVNLSTRPFYNERLVTFLIAIVGVIAIGVAAFSVQQILALSSERTKLRAEIARAEAATSRANTETNALQHSISQKALKGLAINTTLANKLIDERTFSWTTFFSLIGKTLPDDVRIDAVSPSFDKDGVIVLMTVVSKKTDDLATFIEHLQNTGAFYDILPQQEDATDDGTRRTAVTARYLPPKEAK
ncbi:MAG: hypothetical protein EPO35_02810 [Acidobacteria bacterium]|nr:MAG: hypothetical protein EPO35_02810 [Acidobacteriota bacterium]